MGTVLNYIGNYDYYLEKKDVTEKAWLEARALTAASGAAGALQNARSLPEGAAPSSAGQTSLQEQAAAAPEESGKLSWQQQKEAQARARKLQNDLKKTEEEIHRLETRDQEIDELLALEENYSDVEKLMKLNNEKQELTSRLEALYEQWEQLAEQSE